ncbi:UbiX family flavin prenyltransferase [Mucisphaera calidilacus]|uniref:Flavin prenyltransferase UbiX n=1 Tax=Mucisphaera calidilacus TaxID=2527982 RepID=A0A518BVB9_9BACT|nr:UbiX family flavin prenyltransferase [Mucisphaera calidilacus]QDU70901.1 Phenolic acid decarboxylase subunit B [Mucisphaera calidilacus]
MPSNTTSRIVVGITGASGAPYAARLVQHAVAAGREVHLVVSPLGRRLLHDELGMETIDLQALAGPDAVTLNATTTENPATGGRIRLHAYRDVGATIASGSFRHDGMIVIPCSSNSLGAIANGISQNLIHRAAHVTLKERRKLILVHRETPLNLIDINNMKTATEAGALLLPANPGFYMLPKTIDAIIDFIVGRCLDHLDIEHDLNVRWADQLAREDDGHDD